MYTRGHAHTCGVRLIGPAALLHGIDYESQPLIKRGLNRALPLKEVRHA